MKVASYPGFSLIELIVTIVIISLLATFGMPHYSRYLVRIHRLSATQSLASLARAMENYYFEHHTYQGANFNALHFSGENIKKHYRLRIDLANHDSFLIAATPIDKQAQLDKACGTLFLSSTGEKTISGPGQSDGCW